MTSLKKAALAGLCSLAVFSVGTAHATPLISLGLSQDASTPATIATDLRYWKPQLQSSVRHFLRCQCKCHRRAPRAAGHV